MPAWSYILDEIKEVKETRPTAYDEVRREYLLDLHDYTGRDTILYSSGWTEVDEPSAKAAITDTDVHGFMQAIHGLEGDCLDLIVHTPGGTPEVVEQIVHYLREKFEDLRVIVPQSAMSGGTLLCCAADQVVMGHHSSLGPTDPQLRVPSISGEQWTAAHSIIELFEEVREKLENDDATAHYEPVLQHYHPGLLNKAREAVAMSESLAKEFAEKYMFSNEDDAEQKATELGEYLSKRENFKSHNRRISRERIQNETEMHVMTLEDDQELQDLVLSTFHATMATHSERRIVKIIENHEGSTYTNQIRENGL